MATVAAVYTISEPPSKSSLDIIHVIEYLWKAAFIFHSPSSPQAENWVSESWLRSLHR